MNWYDINLHQIPDDTMFNIARRYPYDRLFQVLEQANKSSYHPDH